MGAKLLLAFSLMLVLISIFAAWELYRAEDWIKTLDGLVERRLQKLVAATDLQAAAYRRTDSMYEMVGEEDPFRRVNINPVA